MNYEHVADERMRRILCDDDPTEGDLAYALELCDSCAMLDARNEGVPFEVYGARVRALEAAWRASTPADALKHLRKFWDI